MRVDHAPQHRRADTNCARCSHEPHLTTVPHAGVGVERIDQREPIAKADHFRRQRRSAGPFDLDDRPHRRRKIGHRRGQAHGLHHTAGNAGRGGLGEGWFVHRLAIR